MGDLVHIGSCSGTFFALDCQDGRPRWSHDVKPNGRPTSFHGDALVTDSLIVIGTDGGTHENRTSHIWAFALDGTVRWTCVVEHGVVSDIVRAGNRVLAITRADSLLCLDLASGRRLWSFAGGEERAEFQFLFRSPAVAGGRAYFGDTDGEVHALDLDSGRLLWSRSPGAAISTSILAIGDELVVADVDGRAHRLDQANGMVRGTIPLDDSFSGAPALVGDSLVVFTGQGGIVCVDLGAARVRWSRAMARLSSSRPYLWRGSVLVATANGELIAFRTTDGLPLWSRTFAGAIRGIGQDDRTLYLGTQEGTIYAYVRGKTTGSRAP